MQSDRHGAVDSSDSVKGLQSTSVEGLQRIGLSVHEGSAVPPVDNIGQFLDLTHNPRVHIQVVPQQKRFVLWKRRQWAFRTRGHCLLGPSYKGFSF